MSAYPPAPPALNATAQKVVERYNDLVNGLRLTPLAAPDLRKADLTGQGQVRLEWDYPATLDPPQRFEIERTDGAGAVVTIPVADPGKRTYDDTGLQHGQYRYRMRAAGIRVSALSQERSVSVK